MSGQEAISERRSAPRASAGARKESDCRWIRWAISAGTCLPAQHSL